MKLAELGEFGFIDRIRKAASPGEDIQRGIGDDCAVVRPAQGSFQLTTTDLLIEGVHFRRDWTDPRKLGRKSVAVNVSDIAAMGGYPRHLYLALGIPADYPVSDLDAFMKGFLEAADRYCASLAGGDTCRSPGPLFISVVAEGAVPEEEVIYRDGARPGDVLYVSGTLGDSALALRMMEEGRKPDSFLERRHHDPEARDRLGRALAFARVPSAMIDLSDGLLSDLKHLLNASNAGARLDRDALPLSDSFRRHQGERPEWRDLALNGGEDYELLFTVPPSREGALAEIAGTQGISLARIGTIVPPDDGIGVKDCQGHDLVLSWGGYDHFVRPSLDA